MSCYRTMLLSGRHKWASSNTWGKIRDHLFSNTSGLLKFDRIWISCKHPLGWLTRAKFSDLKLIAVIPISPNNFLSYPMIFLNHMSNRGNVFIQWSQKSSVHHETRHSGRLNQTWIYWTNCTQSITSSPNAPRRLSIHCFEEKSLLKS